MPPRQPKKIAAAAPVRADSGEFPPMQYEPDPANSIPLPPGMQGLIPEQPIRTPADWQRPHDVRNTIEDEPTLTFPNGNRILLSDLGLNDFLLPMTGDQVRKQLVTDLSIDRFTVPAGTIVQCNISGVGVARWLDSSRMWIYLVELVDSVAWIWAATDDQWEVYNGPLG